MRMGCTLNLKTVRRPLRLQTVEKVICVQDQKGNLPAKMSRCWKHPVYTHLCDSSNLRPTAHSTVKKLAQRLKRRKMPSSDRTFMKLELLKWETEWPPKLLKNEMHRMSLLLHGQRTSLTWWQQKLCITISVMQDTFFLAGSPMNKQEDDQGMQESSLHLTLSWCFEPSQPQRITSGLSIWQLCAFLFENDECEYFLAELEEQMSEEGKPIYSRKRS